MTQEEKARAYDEALNKAKTEISTKGIGETVNLCYQLFPQLAENDDEESEDERIRKWLYDLIDEGAYLCERPFATESILAYLEKQKESLHIPETCKENANSFADGIIEVRSFQRGMEEGRRLERQKEQKPLTDEEKEYIRTIKSIISDFIRDKKPEDVVFYQKIYDWLDGRHVPFSCGHENSKFTEWAKLQAEFNIADKSYQIGFRDGVASVKPAEWSEEGEEMRGTCIDLLEHFPRPCGEVIGPWKDCITWLKSLRPSWKPNEEQMEALDKARRFIPYNCDALESLYNDLKKLT